jgi:UDP-glucose 4-epimerase
LADNLSTTIHLLRCSAAAQVPQYIFISSSCVYDFAGARVPHREDDIGICNTSYGLCKMVGEELCRWYAAQYGLRTKIARLFNVYGPGDSFLSPHVIPDFMRKAWEISKGYTRAFPIMGGGQQTRDFTWVDDAAQGILAVAHLGVPGEAYNVGTGHSVTIRRLAEMVLRTFGLEEHVVGFAHEDAPTQDIQQRCASVDKAFRDLRWQATTRLADGLQRVKDHLVPLFEAETDHPSQQEEEEVTVHA